MKTLTFYGHSDDVAVAGDDEYYGIPAAFKVSGGIDHSGPPREEGLIVGLSYAQLGNIRSLPGTWLVGIMQLDEDVPLPPWPMRWKGKGYTVRLEIDVPDEVEIERLS